jgi:PadR family transcriptional regulator, regulatory protein PadR
MRLLTRTEEIMLLSIWRLGENAYGITIREEVARTTGEEWPLGAVYPFLSRLHRAGYARTLTSRSTPERGGRHKIMYRLTDTGKEALAEIQLVNARAWEGIPAQAFRKPA